MYLFVSKGKSEDKIKINVIKNDQKTHILLQIIFFFFYYLKETTQNKELNKICCLNKIKENMDP